MIKKLNLSVENKSQSDRSKTWSLPRPERVCVCIIKQQSGPPANQTTIHHSPTPPSFQFSPDTTGPPRSTNPTRTPLFNISMPTTGLGDD